MIERLVEYAHESLRKDGLWLPNEFKANDRYKSLLYSIEDAYTEQDRNREIFLKPPIGEEIIEGFVDFFFNIKSPENQKIVLYSLLYAASVHEGEKRKTSKLPYIMHPEDMAADLIKRFSRTNLGESITIPFLLTCLLHDVTESRIDKEIDWFEKQIKKSKKAKKKETILLEIQYLNLEMQLMQKRVELRKKYFKQLENDFFKFLEENHIYDEENKHMLANIINVNKCLTRYNSSDQSYDQYVKDMLTKRYTTCGFSLDKMVRLVVIGDKLEDRLKNIESLSTNLKTNVEDILLKGQERLDELFISDYPEYLRQRDKVRNILSRSYKTSEVNQGTSFTPSKSFIESLKNVWFLIYARKIFLEGGETELHPLLRDLGRDFRQATKQALLYQRASLVHVYVEKSKAEHLEKLVKTFKEKGGFRGITTPYKGQITPENEYLIFTKSMSTFHKLISGDEKEMKLLERSKETQLRHVLSLLELLDWFEDPNFTFDTENKITIR